ncbi:MAG: ribosome biogenesis GTP-binding protein YihA/YsxC [Crocinitomicaceae bacterium]
MKITKAAFVISNTDITKCPKPDMPEYAFIGRSNVGKSSLINALTNHKSLAKISGKPGKTRLINHFLINESWYLVDLPGYGFAKTGKTQRMKWEKFINDYLLNRENLLNVFVLIDCRHEPQTIDVNFMAFLGENGIPFSMVFTKLDKLRPSQKGSFLPRYKKEMLKMWEEMPPYFITSSVDGSGKEELLDYIEGVNEIFEKGQ